jgi:lipoprotein NlpI
VTTTGVSNMATYTDQELLAAIRKGEVYKGCLVISVYKKLLNRNGWKDPYRAQLKCTRCKFRHNLSLKTLYERDTMYCSRCKDDPPECYNLFTIGRLPTTNFIFKDTQ